IGMIFSLFAPYSRFRELLRYLVKSMTMKTLILFTFLSAAVAYGQDSHDHNHDHDHEHTHEHTHEHEQTMPAAPVKPVVYFITEDQSDELASLLVQDNRGRIIPMHTMCDQVLRKLYRADKYEG